MNNRIKEGDRVFITCEEETGTVVTVYPEINTATVKTSFCLMKCKLDDLVVLPETSDEPTEIKKASLLDKVKSHFSR